MKNKKTKFALVLVTVLAIVGIYLYQNTTLFWQTYSDPDLGFSFKYPRGWYMETTKKLETWDNLEFLANLTKEGTDNYFEINVQKNEKGTPESWIENNDEKNSSAKVVNEVINKNYVKIIKIEGNNSWLPQTCHIAFKNKMAYAVCLVDVNKTTNEIETLGSLLKDISLTLHI